MIGRAPDADLRFSDDDPFMSRRHVYLEVCPPRCRLQDIGETNPIHVNGHPVTAAELQDGDVIELGYTELKVTLAAVITPAIRNCRRCGKPVELVPGEEAPESCSACQAAPKPTPAAPPAPRPITCPGCQADLTTRAHSDGHAQDYEGVAIYACEQCLPPSDAAAGTVIGAYELRKQLGIGGCGAVYVAYHRPTARLWALKQVKDLKDPLLIQRFQRREIRLSRQVVHPNVVRAVDAGIDGKGVPFLVSEYVPGGSLEDAILLAGGRLPVPEALRITRAVLDGVQFLHERQIVHRDIKPPNVLLKAGPPTGSKGVPPTPKLADFGLAKSYAEAGGFKTKPGLPMGTLMYMPPEQVKDASTVKEPADLYAVGVTLYYMLTGKYSFDFPTQRDVDELARQHGKGFQNRHEAEKWAMKLLRVKHPYHIILSEEPVPVRTRDAAVPRKLAEMVDRAVCKEAKARFQTAAEFRSALEQAGR